MRTIPKIKFLFLISLLISCQSKVNELDIKDSNLSLVNNILHYQEKPYSGILYSKADTLVIYKATYVKGKKHGKEQKYFYNGDLAEQRFYNQGKNSGTHQSWWKKGQLKSEYHFNINADSIGLQREWHSNGKLAKQLNYVEGKENGTQKEWDFNGKIKANYIVINGERFGSIGSKNCKNDAYLD